MSVDLDVGLQVKVVGQMSRSNYKILCFDVLSDLFVGLEYAFYTMHVRQSGRYVGSACRVLTKITMTHGVNTVQDLCVFVRNQEMFAIQSCVQRSRHF